MELEFTGTVEDNNDPLKLGRLKIRISIWEDLPAELIPWASQRYPHFLGLTTGSVAQFIPEIGSEVLVSFPTKDKYHPEYDKATLTNRNKCNFFDEDYPNSYGIKDSIGNYIKINKTKKGFRLQHSSGSHIDMYEETGEVVIKHSDTAGEEGEDDIPGAFIKMDKNGKIFMSCEDMQVNATKTIKMNTKEFQIDASESVKINTKEVQIDASESVKINTEDTTITSRVHIIGDTDIIGNETITGNLAVLGSGIFGGTSVASDHLSGGISGKGHIHFAPHEAGFTSSPS